MIKRMLEWRRSESVDHEYLIFLPAGYDNAPSEWPLVTYLHGGGADQDAILSRIEPLLNRPFVLLIPLCPPTPANMAVEHQTWDHRIVGAIVSHVMAEYRVTARRSSLMGFSMGGSAAWELPYYHPELFTKVAVISGSTHFWKLRYFPKIPVWAFSGGAEDWIRYHRQTVDAAKEFGIEVTYTIWPGLDHGGCRTRSLEYSALIDWLHDDSVVPVQPDD